MRARRAGRVVPERTGTGSSDADAGQRSSGRKTREFVTSPLGTSGPVGSVPKRSRRLLLLHAAAGGSRLPYEILFIRRPTIFFVVVDSPVVVLPRGEHPSNARQVKRYTNEKHARNFPRRSPRRPNARTPRSSSASSARSQRFDAVRFCRVTHAFR